MNVDRILEVLGEEQVDYLLIGGMNCLLRERKLRRMAVLKEAIAHRKTTDNTGKAKEQQ